jgi:Secretion system C-terminal sorting domain
MKKIFLVFPILFLFFHLKSQTNLAFCIESGGSNIINIKVTPNASYTGSLENIQITVTPPAGGTNGAILSGFTTKASNTYGCVPCGNVTWTSGTAYIVGSFSVTGNGAYTLSSVYGELLGATTSSTICTTALPLSLTTFQAAPAPSAIALDWGSTNELNFSGFEIERGMDGKDFQKIAWVAAKGGVSVAEYKHLDQTAQRGTTYYYRLKMIDNDGIFKYSPVRTARLGEGTIQAFPNPSSGQYTIALDRTQSTEGTISVIDIMGRMVKTERRTLDNTLSLDLNSLPNGVYHVKVDDGAAAQMVRVVKGN